MHIYVGTPIPRYFFDQDDLLGFEIIILIIILILIILTNNHWRKHMEFINWDHNIFAGIMVFFVFSSV